MATRTVPGEIDPDSLPSLPREQIIGMMSKALRAKYPALEAKLGEEERRNLLAEYDIGRLTGGLLDAAKYGSHALLLVAAASGVPPARLYRAARFYEHYPNRKEVEKLMARRGTGGYRFGWSHLLQLLSIDNPDRRAELIEVSFRDALTVRQLAERIHSTHDNKAGRPRRTVALPRTLSGGLAQLTTMTQKLRTKFQSTLPECVLPDLAELPAEQINEDVLERVAQVREEMSQLSREAAEGAAELARAEQELARRVAEANGPVGPSSGAPEPHEPPRQPPTARRGRTRRPVEA